MAIVALRYLVALLGGWDFVDAGDRLVQGMALGGTATRIPSGG